MSDRRTGGATCGTTCPVCRGNRDMVKLYDNGVGHEVFECRRCEVVVLDTSLEVTVIEDAHYYDEKMEAVYVGSRDRMLDTAKSYVEATEKATGPLAGRRVLDVGAGIGCFVEQATSAGARAEALDIQESATRFVQSLGHEARTGLIYDVAAETPGSFDVVTAWNVIEHDDDPRRFVESAWKLLRPGGWFVFETPDNFHPVKKLVHGYFSLAPPILRPVFRNLHTETGHRYGFSPRSGVRLLENVGFERCESSSISYDALVNFRKVLSSCGSSRSRVATALAVGGALAAMQLVGIRNRFLAFGRKPV